MRFIDVVLVQVATMYVISRSMKTPKKRLIVLVYPKSYPSRRLPVYLLSGLRVRTRTQTGFPLLIGFILALFRWIYVISFWRSLAVRQLQEDEEDASPICCPAIGLPPRKSHSTFNLCSLSLGPLWLSHVL